MVQQSLGSSKASRLGERSRSSVIEVQNNDERTSWQNNETTPFPEILPTANDGIDRGGRREGVLNDETRKTLLVRSSPSVFLEILELIFLSHVSWWQHITLIFILVR